MKKITGMACIAFIILSLFHFTVKAGENGKHLFILSGQSNMARFNTKAFFVPLATKKFGEDNIIIVKNAHGGQPIKRWYKEWKPAKGTVENKKGRKFANGDLYDLLIADVRKAIKDQEIASVTFIWMQGEADAMDKQGDVYAESLKGVYDQLCKDMERKDIHFIIGRINDHDMENQKFTDWTKIRDIQVKVAESNNLFDWIDTDDLNGNDNELHCTGDGFKELGIRYIEKAAEKK